jgi:hypothetical protein
VRTVFLNQSRLVFFGDLVLELGRISIQSKLLSLGKGLEKIDSPQKLNMKR